MTVSVLLTTKGPQLSTDGLDAAWSELPAADRTSKSVEQLAQQIVKAKRGISSECTKTEHSAQSADSSAPGAPFLSIRGRWVVTSVASRAKYR